MFYGHYTIYLQWVSAGISDAIKSVLFCLNNVKIYHMFKNAVDVNTRIANLILDFLDDNKNDEKVKSVIAYFIDCFYTDFLIKCAELYNEDLIEKLLKSYIKIALKPVRFVRELGSHATKKFIKSLFKRKLQFRK